ncbi:Hypothetical protein MexAM1_META1p2810 [Methylorubrum extorquens AM1]|uniref:Uncharacterized protein n=1 Tax=Methylorubrum extorquens (strain ATCC 14718 / DSM 1338 / JCM 2805 / NCIMB 9133 / AM1) TaxID=272630 RepID=C5ATN9_METEA|nr:Hypothetical protein MexAM1_META1p2810 [Methylorubrum extorquens AM1]
MPAPSWPRCRPRPGPQLPRGAGLRGSTKDRLSRRGGLPETARSSLVPEIRRKDRTRRTGPLKVGGFDAPTAMPWRSMIFDDIQGAGRLMDRCQ